MHVAIKPVVVGLVASIAMGAMILPAAAKCTRLAFSVNDYGKDGPIRDAKSLLDKYIAQWTAERGIAKYTTGPKAVSCELFLDVIVFDEHTCKAEATVCWADGAGAKGAKGAATSAAAQSARPAKSTAADAAKQ